MKCLFHSFGGGRDNEGALKELEQPVYRQSRERGGKIGKEIKAQLNYEIWQNICMCLSLSVFAYVYSCPWGSRLLSLESTEPT